jgi:hypothetical protein
MSSEEFVEWIAFHNVDPWSEYRADLRNAIVACIIANANRGKRQRAFKVDDFIPKFNGKAPRKSVAQLRTMLCLFAKSTGGAVTNG